MKKCCSFLNFVTKLFFERYFKAVKAVKNRFPFKEKLTPPSRFITICQNENIVFSFWKKENRLNKC